MHSPWRAPAPAPLSPHHCRDPRGPRQGSERLPLSGRTVLPPAMSSRCISRRCANGVRTSPPLARHFLRRVCAAAGRPEVDTEPPALAIIKAYSWPGNIRQLENIIKRLVVLNRSIILVAPARDAQRRKECPRSAGSTPRSIGTALVHNTAATRAGCGVPSLARLAQLGPSVGPLGSSKHRHDDLLDENHK